MWSISVASFLYILIKISATHGARSCTEDELYSSLSRGGRRFCSSVLNSHCRTLATPTQFTTYEPVDVSSQCACLLTEFTARETPTSQAGASATGSDRTLATSFASSSKSRAGRPGRPPATSSGRSTSRSLASVTTSSSRTTTTKQRQSSRSEGPSVSFSGVSSGTSAKSSFLLPSNGSVVLPTNAPSTTSRLNTATGGPASTRLGTVPIESSVGWNSTATAPSISGTRTRTEKSTSIIDSFATSSSTGAISRSQGNLTATATSNSSTFATPLPTFLTPTGLNSTAPTLTGSIPATSATLPSANFTQVTRTAHLAEESCYHLPTDPQEDRTRRALLHNAKLREENATIPYPYVESIEFESEGVDPLYLTVRDVEEGTHMIDVSNKSRIAIVDGSGNSMLLDGQGIYFATNSCQYDVSILIDNIYQQLAGVSGEKCSIGGLKKRMEDINFKQTLFLRDQCNKPVTQDVRTYPELRVGKTKCSESSVDESTGRWGFDCTFPGSESNSMKCKWAVKHDVLDFLLIDPFGGACPDVSTVISTLDIVGYHLVSSEAIRAELYNLGLNRLQRKEAELIITKYSHLWDMLKQIFSKRIMSPSGNENGLNRYINVYNAHRDFENDVCEGIHSTEIPLKLGLIAGATRIEAVTTLNWAPEATRPFNITIQDPSDIACCSRGSVAIIGEDEEGKTCAYPESAFISGTNCVCGLTVGGTSVAFGYTECENFVSTCDSDADCAKSGDPSLVCLTGSCCGGGVCIDPYQCSQNGTGLVQA